MKIETTLFGTVEFDEKSIIVFDEGLIGVSDKKRFLLIEKEDFKPFSYLQSIDDPQFTLVVLSPFFIENNYKFDVHEDDLSSIGINDVKDMLILCIVVFSNRIEEITVNLKAPIIININTKKAKQIILLNEIYTVAEPLVKQETIQNFNNKKVE